MEPGQLVCASGPHAGEVFRWHGPMCAVGRDAASAVCLALDPTTSRHHAIIEETPAGFTIADAGSTHGTWLNGARLTAPELLKNGDLLRFGQCAFRYESAPDPQQAPTMAMPSYAPTQAPPAATPGPVAQPAPQGWPPPPPTDPFAGLLSPPPGMTIPPELQGGFNWGAFYFTWIWGVNHRAYLTLLSLAAGAATFGIAPVGMVHLALQIWFGLKGNEWAWLSGRFSTPQECLYVQRIWAKWALWMFIATAVLAVLLICIVFAFIAANTPSHSTGGIKLNSP